MSNIMICGGSDLVDIIVVMTTAVMTTVRATVKRLSSKTRCLKMQCRRGAASGTAYDVNAYLGLAADVLSNWQHSQQVARGNLPPSMCTTAAAGLGAVRVGETGLQILMIR